MNNVNCTSYGPNGKCLHQAAPRRLLGPAKCIVWLFQQQPPSERDPRATEPKCALCTPVARRPNCSHP